MKNTCAHLIFVVSSLASVNSAVATEFTAQRTEAQVKIADETNKDNSVIRPELTL